MLVFDCTITIKAFGFCPSWQFMLYEMIISWIATEHVISHFGKVEQDSLVLSLLIFF